MNHTLFLNMQNFYLGFFKFVLFSNIYIFELKLMENLINTELFFCLVHINIGSLINLCSAFWGQTKNTIYLQILLVLKQLNIICWYIGEIKKGSFTNGLNIYLFTHNTNCKQVYLTTIKCMTS